MRPACVPGKQRLQPAGWHSPQLVLRRHRQAAAAGPPLPEPELHEPQEQAQPEAAFDIVSRNRLPPAEGLSCTWPRPEQRKRWEDAALMTTGFPVPAGYGGASRQPATGSGMLWALRNPARQPRAGLAATAAAAAVAARQATAAPGQRSSAGAEEEDVMPAYATPVVPVFRAAPYSAEAARQRRPSTTARILLLDDGCTCRAPLAAALLQSMLRKLPRPLDVEVLAASIGPPVPGPHDERVAQMAREMAIPLPPRRPPPREFDEMRDTVDCDLILVMDRYDRQEVEREVSVLERLNPGGAYLTRIRRLGEFARVGQVVHRDRCLLVPDDVPDPFYGTVSDAAEQASLRQTVHTLALCCRGLIAYLLKLRARSGTAAAVPLRLAVAQSLQCPLMDPTSHHAVSALIHCQLGPAKLALWQQQGKGGQDIEGSAAGTRRWRSRVKPGGGAGTPVRHAGDWSAHVSGWPRPVWVEASANDSGDEDSSDDRRPLWTVREVAGQTVVVRRARRGAAAARPGYWANVENVERELRKWMEASGLTGRLPSQQELRASGANTLSAMVGSHGGLALFAQRMGLQLASGRAANGHWANFEHLAAELWRFVEDRHSAPAPAAAPTPPVAGATGAANSVAAQQQQQQQGEPAPPLQRQQQAQIGQAAAAGSSKAGAAPAAAGRSAGRRRPPRFASRSWSSGGGGLDAEAGAVKVKLLASGGKAGQASGSSGTDATSTSKQSSSKDGNASSSGSSGGDGTPSSLLFMPTQQELRSAGRTDLIGGIRQQGGSLAVAARLGWGVRHGRLPSETAVVAQLLDFVDQEGEQAWRRRRRGGPGAGDASGVLLGMPTLKELEECGRADLASAVVRLGGVQVFAHMLEREQQRRQRRKRRSSKQEGEGAVAELALAPPVRAGMAPETAADTFSTQPPPPPPQQQQSSHILTYPYGLASGSGRQPPPPSQPQPAIVRVGASVVQLIEARGWDRRVPTKQELVAAGRRDLHAAITRCGGGQKLAEHLQLPYAETRGRRKRCEVERPSPQQQQQQLELQGSFLAARLRPPPGCAEDVGAKLAAAGGGGAGARAAYAHQRAGIPSAQQRKGPASRLLEKELVLEAYEDVTFV